MSSSRKLALTVLAFVLAVAGSGVLYMRSRSADFDRHARSIEAIGAVRHLSESLSEQVLAARFGLLNQYDPLTNTELALTDAVDDLDVRVRAAVHDDVELEASLAKLADASTDQHDTVERFKAENSVLRNSLYYLPTAAEETTRRLASASAPPDLAELVNRLSRAALVYNLRGDESARAAYLIALREIEGRKGDVPTEAHAAFNALLAHAGVIGKKQPSVDEWVKRAVGTDVGDRLHDVEAVYSARFGHAVATSNLYRKILYGWSLALVALVGLVVFQLRRLYADLERRVRDRTEDLKKALDALWGEMKLARKIQEALVPSAPTLDDCEVAASMKPAEEVGGDYYDVIRAGSAEWILIGDVSGHGIPAGLVMMMCQTAVRTVLAIHPEISPDKLLATVNTVLTRNIRQLGEDKYMTISAFRREANGTVFFSGAHQDVFVYRADNDEIESLESEGMWLGLKEDIHDALTTRRFQLRPGDVLVLYSDGITEATRDGAMFEPAGIRRVLGRARGKTAQEVLADLEGELEGYCTTDDATLLIIRQLDTSTRSVRPPVGSSASVAA